MGTIYIKRNSKYIDAGRDYKIYIDGKKALKIADGTEKALDIEAGKHTIYGKIDFFKSQKITFEIGEDEEMEFEIENNIGLLKMSFVYMFSFGIAMLVTESIFGRFNNIGAVMYVCSTFISINNSHWFYFL